MDVGNLISGSTALSKFSLDIWKFSVHILLKPGLENFEYYFASVWNEAVIKIIPKKKKCKEKWLSEEGLQIAEKRREAKGKWEKESYILLNAKFQRIARRDKKTFLIDQCREIEENNRMGKTRDLFKKTRFTKGTFCTKTGTIKDRNGMDLIEAEDIKKRWQEYTEEL